ncbi:hypothetical protein NAEGRDRAFT_78456 [Naegleria gruberi]|uniref:DUF4139 domain-containing protein n=1 Tax=Naegleria gruberi TaxID=5762 RepID=D2V3W5_NAEGR|nr:uncharacterized protein NAEGRDRAFT_78456 [Naegleria gruberi]EFC48269.1 hypothetical protein NAEGRDRAFT_78456 [Naegleria gruberi]|eukprot:XP_002681013.1 hypothetical protein NAEGRDRAFT_78456 [Naegleria gruberi strain NEG-M]
MKPNLFLLAIYLCGVLLFVSSIDPSEEKPTMILFHTDLNSSDSRLVLHANGSATVERIFSINDMEMIKAFVDQDRMQIRLDGLSSWIDPKSFMATVQQDTIMMDKMKQQEIQVDAGGNRLKKVNTDNNYLMFKEQVYTKVPDDREMKKRMKEKLVAEQKVIQKKIVSYENMKKQIVESKFELDQFEQKLKLVDELMELMEKNQIKVDELEEKIQEIGKTQLSSSMYFEFSSKVPEFVRADPKPFILKIKYIISKGRFNWTPQYLLSVDSSTQTGQLMFMANVVQKTGENFTNALVELSTDELGQAPSMPEFNLLTLDQTDIYKYLRKTNSPHTFAGSSFISLTSKKLMSDQRNYQNQFEGANIESNQMDQNSQVSTDVIRSTTSYMIAERASFITDSNGSDKTVSLLIAKINLESKWYHKVIPKQSSRVYTIMAIKNKSKYQLIPGDVNIFINNVLSTQSRIKSDVFPDDVFQLDIGIDRMVSVKLNDHNKNEQESGWFSKTNSITENSQITIENKKDVPINITVINALPFTEDWHTDDKLQIILTQPKTDQGKDIDLHEIFLPKPGPDGKDTFYPTEYQFNTKVGKKDMKCKIKKRNHALERNFSISSKESIVLPLSFQMCVTLAK